ncbi:PREDICTED: uncharacterized protein LOC104782345 isoform X2 [Camelina sativa]|nr:PREDICTED: uncharacterized protein LOC104782345 isoform X2 [Camelina sativa]
MCRLRDCSVCECPDSEFPEIFKKPLSQYNPVCQEGKPQATVDRTVDTRAIRGGWTVTDNPWTSDDETDNEQFDPMGDGDGSVEVPVYYGDEDPAMWISWVEDYFTDHGFTEETKISFAYGFMEGVALLWFQESHVAFTSWNEIKIGLLQRFSKGKESVVADLTQSDEFDSKMSRWTSCLDKLEKYLLETEECLEKPSGEEKEKTAAAEVVVCQRVAEKEDLLDNIFQKEQMGVQKEPDIEKSEHVHQVFDQMPMERKVNTKKKKKKRWKTFSKIDGSESGFKLKGDTGFVELLTKRIEEHMNFYLPQVLEEHRNHREQAAKPNHVYQVFEELSQRGKKTTTKRIRKKFTKAKGFKYKAGIVKLGTSRIQMKNIHDRPDTTILVYAGKNYHLLSASQVFNKRLRGDNRLTRKKKKKPWKNHSNNYNPHGVAEGCVKSEGVMLKIVAKWWNCGLLKDSVEMGNKKTCVKMKMHHRTFNKRLLWQGYHAQQKKNMMKMEYASKGITHYLYVHQWVYEKLSLRYLTVLKKLANWRKHKFKQKRNKHEKKNKERFSRNQVVLTLNFILKFKYYEKRVQEWCKKESWKGEHVEVERKIDYTKPHRVKCKTVKLDWTKLIWLRRLNMFIRERMETVRGSQSLDMTYMTVGEMTDIIGLISWVVAYLEEHDKQMHQVILDVLKVGIRTAMEMMSWSSRKRHKFRHKRKSKLLWELMTVDKKHSMTSGKRVKFKKKYRNTWVLRTYTKEETPLGKGLMETTYFKRTWALSLGKEFAIATTRHAVCIDVNKWIQLSVLGIEELFSAGLKALDGRQGVSLEIVPLVLSAGFMGGDDSSLEIVAAMEVSANRSIQFHLPTILQVDGFAYTTASGRANEFQIVLKISVAVVSGKIEVKLMERGFLVVYLNKVAEREKEKNGMAWKIRYLEQKPWEIEMVFQLDDVTAKQIIMLPSSVSSFAENISHDEIEDMLTCETLIQARDVMLAQLKENLQVRSELNLDLEARDNLKTGHEELLLKREVMPYFECPGKLKEGVG